MSTTVDQRAVDGEMGSSGDDEVHSTKLESSESGWGTHVNHAPVSLSLGHLCSDGNSEDSSSVSAAGSGDGPFESQDSVDFVLSHEEAPVNTLSIVSVESIREKSDPAVTENESKRGASRPEVTPGLIRVKPLERMSDGMMVSEEEFIGNVLSIPEPSDNCTSIEINDIKSLIPNHDAGKGGVSSSSMHVADSEGWRLHSNLPSIPAQSAVQSPPTELQRISLPLPSVQSAYQKGSSGGLQPSADNAAPKVYKCPKCSRTFKHKMHLARHKSVHNYVCKLCSRSFSRSELLENHLREHEIKLYAAKQGELTPVGDLTNASKPNEKETSSPAVQMNFYKEISNETGEKAENSSSSPIDEISPSPSVEADAMDLLVGPSFNLQRDENGYYKCRFCERSFEKVKNLRIHEHKHARKKHSCTVCGKEYTLKGSLYSHMRTHEEQLEGSPGKSLRDRAKVTYYDGSENESPAEEEIASLMSEDTVPEYNQVPSKGLLQTVPTSSLVFRHFLDNSPLYDVDVKTEPLSFDYSCVYCEKRFLYENACQVHQEKHHQQRMVIPSMMVYPCPICGMRFQDKERLDVHKDKFHSDPTGKQSPGSRLRCRLCLRDFQTELLLRIHEESHTEEGSGADGSSPIPTTIQRIPLGSNNYICVDCGERCPSAQELEEHRKNHINFLLKHTNVKRLQQAPVSVPFPNNAGPKGAVKCFKCFNLFLNDEWFKKHARACWQPSEKPKDTLIQCVYCSQCLVTEEDWLRHQNEHFCQMGSLVSSVKPLNDDENPIILCPQCKQRHHGIIAFNKHMWEAHETRFQGNVPKDMKWQEIAPVKEKPLRKIEASLNLSDSTDVAFKIELKRNRKRKKCTVCRRWFANRLYFLRHIQAKHKPRSSKPKPRLTCNICGKVYSMNAFLEKHLRTHEEELNTGAISSEGLTAVYKTYLSNLSDDLMECKYCDFKCSTMKAFISHVKSEHYEKNASNEGIHLRERLYKCHYCARHFPSEEAWLKHERDFHTGVCSCPRCGKDFENNKALQSHVAEEHKDEGSSEFTSQYAGEMDSVDSICDSEEESEAKQGTTVKRDQSVYSYDKLRTKGDGIIHCPFCKKIFTKKRWLKTHVTVRHKRKFKDNAGPLFKCDACGKRFNLLTALEKHSRFCHSNLPLYKCKFCDQKYRKLYWLKMHMRCHTKTRFNELNHDQNLKMLTETQEAGDGSYFSTVRLSTPKESVGDQPSETSRIKIDTLSSMSEGQTESSVKLKMESAVSLSTCGKQADSLKEAPKLQGKLLSEKTGRKIEKVGNVQSISLKETPKLQIKPFLEKKGKELVSKTDKTPNIKTDSSLEQVKNESAVSLSSQVRNEKPNSKSILRSINTLLPSKPKSPVPAESPKASPNACPICFKDFITPEILKIHTDLKHTEKNDKSSSAMFKCNICSRGFPEEALLEKHRKIHDTESDSKECHVCNKKFHAPDLRIRHIQLYHPEETVTETSLKDAKPPLEKPVHQTHQKVDEPNRSNVEYVIDEQGNKIYRCRYCPRVFSRACSLGKHKKSHVEYQPETFTLKIKDDDEVSLSGRKRTSTKKKSLSDFECEDDSDPDWKDENDDEPPDLSSQESDDDWSQLLEEEEEEEDYVEEAKSRKEDKRTERRRGDTPKPVKLNESENTENIVIASDLKEEKPGNKKKEDHSVSPSKLKKEVELDEEAVQYFKLEGIKWPYVSDTSGIWPHVRRFPQKTEKEVRTLERDYVEKLVDECLPLNLNELINSNKTGESSTGDAKHRSVQSSGEVCQTCERVFTSNHYLKAHVDACVPNSAAESNEANGYDLKDIRDNFKASFCLFCNRSLKNKKGARIHLTKTHKIRSCHICDEVFASKQEFLEHELTHSQQKREEAVDENVASQCENAGSKYSIFEFTDEDGNSEKEKKKKNKHKKMRRRGIDKRKFKLGSLRNFRKMFKKGNKKKTTGLAISETQESIEGIKAGRSGFSESQKERVGEEIGSLENTSSDSPLLTSLKEGPGGFNKSRKLICKIVRSEIQMAEKPSGSVESPCQEKHESEDECSNNGDLVVADNNVDQDVNSPESEEDLPEWGKDQNICSNCGKICKNEFWLKKHSMVCSGGKYQCMDIAPVTATVPEDIFQETSDDDSDKSSKQEECTGYICKCTMKFSTLQEFTAHTRKCLKNHDEVVQKNTENTYSCECKETFLSQSQFEQHKLGCATWYESENANLIEEPSGKKRLLAHDISLPTKRRKYKCKCGKVFTKSNLFSKHIVYCSTWKEEAKQSSEDDNKQSYSCCFCKAIFCLLDDYADHIEQHSEPQHRPNLTCEICHKTYQYQSSLEKHLLKCHSVEADSGLTYICSVCNASYATPGRLISHVQTHKNSGQVGGVIEDDDDTESGEYTCEWCYQQFKDEESYIHHLDEHTGEDADSSLTSGRLSDPDSSISGNKVERPLKCDQCDMRFEKPRQLQNHLRRHKNAAKGAFTCPVCDKKFSYHGPYESHVKLHSLNVQLSEEAATTSFYCKHCKRTLDEACFDEHMASHDQEELNNSLHTCTECGESYSSSQLLDRHMKYKHGYDISVESLPHHISFIPDVDE